MKKIFANTIPCVFPGSRSRQAARLMFSLLTFACVPHVLAEVFIDPFNEGNTAVTGYFERDGEISFYRLYAGSERIEGRELNPGAAGFGDVLFQGGAHGFADKDGSYIGLRGADSAESRGRVFVKGPDTTLRAHGGLYGFGDGSVLSITDGARLESLYSITMTDSVAGGGAAQLIVSGQGSQLNGYFGEYSAGFYLGVDSGVGEAKVLIAQGGRISLEDGSYSDELESSLSKGEINADFEVSGVGSIFETDHLFYLTSGEGESARVLDGGLILQTDDFSDLVERPIAFSYSGGTDEASGLLVAGAGSRIDLVNDALLGDSAYVTLRDGGSLTTDGTVYIEAASPGATKVVLDRGRIDAGGAVVIDDGAQVLALNGSTVGGDVKVNGGTLGAERGGLAIAGDLAIERGTLALEVTQASRSEYSRSALAMSAGQQPALVVEGNVLFGPDSFIRLLLSAVPNGEILVDDYLLADSIDFAPQFSLAAALDVQFANDVDLSKGAEFSVRFASLDQTVAYRYGKVSAVPEIDAAGLPLVAGLLLALFAWRRERRG